MQHKGEIVENAIRNSGFSITELAKRIGKSRRWFYQVFESGNISLDAIIKIGKIIHHDFSDEIKELKKYKIVGKAELLADAETSYSQKQKDTDNYKEKYYALLEKYNELLVKQNKRRKK